MPDHSNPQNEAKIDNEINLKKDFIAPTYDDWKKLVEEDLKGVPFEKKLITRTYEGINLQPIYTKNDLSNLEFINSLPGKDNFIRGSKAEGYFGDGWEICQQLSYGDADEFNSALKYDLERGQNSISILLDQPSQLGLDADYAKPGEVGNGGLSISGIRSITRTLDGIDLEKYPLHIDTGFSSLPILILLNAYLNNTDIDIKNIKGSITADPLGYLIKAGTLPMSPEKVYNELSVSAEWCIKNIPHVKTIGVDAGYYHDCGAGAVQELAFAFSAAIEYLNQLASRGLSPDETAKQFRFTFGIGSFYFMEIAKLRAARLIWSNILKAFGVAEENRKMTIHARTSLFNQTMYDPFVNMLRTTTEVFSGILGGADSLQTNPFDELFGIPDQFSRRIARNTQLILKEESHLDQVIDPAGGSYYVENLTNEIAKEVWKLIQVIDSKGGMFEALKQGFPQSEINRIRQQKFDDTAKRKSVIVGTNMYSNTKEEKLKRRDDKLEEIYKQRKEYLQRYRTSLDQKKNIDVMEKLEKISAEKTEEVINFGKDAILAGATMGEVAKALRVSYSGSMEIEKLTVIRPAEMFEKLRDKLEGIKIETGEKPKVFLAGMGPLKQFKARADFSRAFFEIAGFDIVYPNGFKTPGEAVHAAIESNAKIIVICSPDETYPELVPAITKGIKEKNSVILIVLAGYPKDQIEAHKNSGVDEFIYLGCDAVKVLSGLLNRI
ncbi:MAG: methylmalonyl-CoA mutase family protein [bacterium]